MNYAPRLVDYSPRVMLQLMASLTDDSRGAIYDLNIFIVQAPDATCTLFQTCSIPEKGSKLIPAYCRAPSLR